MKNKLVKAGLLMACTLGVLVTVGILIRNYEFDSAADAMKTGDYSAAVPKLKTLASLGDGRAQYVLGIMYATGTGTKKNDEEAIRWFRKAAMGTQGEADPAAAAEFAVGKSYAYGTEGVERNLAESQKWLRRAANGGSKEAMRELQKSTP